MKEQLNKQIGPFKLWQWLIVAAAGITLGLVVKNRFAAKSDFSGVATPSVEGGEFGPTQGANTQLQFDFASLLRFLRESDRFRDEEDNRDDGGNDDDGFDPSGRRRIGDLVGRTFTDDFGLLTFDDGRQATRLEDTDPESLERRIAQGIGGDF